MKRTILSTIGPSLAITLVTIFVGGCLADTEEELSMNEEDQSGQAAALVGEDGAEVGAVPTKSASGVGPGETIPICSWTQWYDNDNPGGGGDYEMLGSQIPIVCAPSLVECKTLAGVNSSATGQNVTCNLQGFYCQNSQQTPGNSCQDYKVRFCCPGPSMQ